jgi:hypothetical protein
MNLLEFAKGDMTTFKTKPKVKPQGLIVTLRNIVGRRAGFNRCCLSGIVTVEGYNLSSLVRVIENSVV